MLTFVGITFFGHILTKIQSSWFGPSCIFLDNRLYIHTIFLEEKLFLPPYHAIQAIFYRTLPLSWFISEMFHQIRTNPRRRILSSLSGLVFSFLRIANRPILFSLSAVLLQNLFVTSLLDTFVLEIHINKPNNLFLAKISKTFLLLWLFLKVKDTEFSYWSLVVYKCFLVETDWSSNAAPSWHHFACSCENGDVGYFGRLSRVRVSGLSTEGWREKGDNRSWQTEVNAAATAVLSVHKNNNVMMVRRSWTSFRFVYYFTYKLI